MVKEVSVAKITIRLLVAGLLSVGYLYLCGNSLITTVYGLKVFTYLVPIIALLGSIAGGFFNMGVRGYSKTNTLLRLLPITYVVAILAITTTIQQTYPTAIFSGILIGNSFSYIGRIVSDIVGKKRK